VKCKPLQEPSNFPKFRIARHSSDNVRRAAMGGLRSFRSLVLFHPAMCFHALAGGCFRLFTPLPR